MDVEENSSISSSSCEKFPASSPSSSKRKAGRKKFRETRHPVYHGVRERKGGKWVCEIRDPGNKRRRIWVGTFATPEMAARAHDIALLATRGESARLNFVDSAWALPRAKTAAPVDIRRAAMEAAEMDGPAKAMGFEDEEAIYNMPGLLDSMAEGMLLTPPAMQRGFDWDDGVESYTDLSLWND